MFDVEFLGARPELVALLTIADETESGPRMRRKDARERFDEDSGAVPFRVRTGVYKDGGHRGFLVLVREGMSIRAESDRRGGGPHAEFAEARDEWIVRGEQMACTGEAPQLDGA
jgi:hypothetical protein